MNGTTAQAPAAAAAKAPPTLRTNTRKRFVDLGSLPVTGFQTDMSLKMPDYGFASRIFAFFDLQVVPGANNANAGLYGPYGLVRKARFETNLGTGETVDASGFGLHIVNLSSERGLDYQTQKFANEPLYANPANLVAATPVNIRFMLEFPIAANPHQNFGLGLVNLQAPEIQTNVKLAFGTPSDLFGVNDGAMTISGNVLFGMEYFEVPPPSRKVPLPPLVAYRTIEEKQPFQATGDVRYTYPRMGKLLRTFVWAIANGAMLVGYHQNPGAASNASPVGIDSFRLKLLGSDTVYDRKAVFGQFIQRRMFSNTGMPPGIHVFDEWSATGEPNRGDARDWFDTAAITTTDLYASINAAVALGVGNNNLYVVRQILQSYTLQSAKA